MMLGVQTPSRLPEGVATPDYPHAHTHTLPHAAVTSATNPSDEHNMYDVIGDKTTMATSKEIKLKSNAAYVITHPLYRK